MIKPGETDQISLPINDTCITVQGFILSLHMGSGQSAFGLENNYDNNREEDEERKAVCSINPCLKDIPENCVALILACLEPPEICRCAQLNKSFERASSADFVWESKLPDNYKILYEKLFNEKPGDSLVKKEIYAKLCSPIRFGAATKEVWLEKKRGGICVSISWKGLKITGIDDRRYWSHISTNESRFNSIAYLQQIWWLEVDGNLEFHFHKGKYSLYFRLRLGLPVPEASKGGFARHQVRGWDKKPVNFHLWTSDGNNITSDSYLSEKGKWINYHVGDFVVENSNAPTKISFSMTQIDCTHSKCGLCLDSVLILPKLIAKGSA